LAALAQQGALADPVQANNSIIAERTPLREALHNDDPKPFFRTAVPDIILGKVARETQALASMQ